MSGAARIYAELSGEVTNDVADRIASAAMEVLLESAGGIPGVGNNFLGKYTGEALSKLDNVLKKLPVSLEKGLRFSGELVGHSLSEFGEEYFSAIAEPVIRNLCLDENNEFKPFSEEALLSGLIGAFTAAGMNIAMSGNISTEAKVGTYENRYIPTVDFLEAELLKAGVDSKAAKITAMEIHAGLVAQVDAGLKGGRAYNKQLNAEVGKDFVKSGGEISKTKRDALIHDGLASENKNVRAYAEKLSKKGDSVNADELGYLSRMIESDGYPELKRNVFSEEDKAKIASEAAKLYAPRKANASSDIIAPDEIVIIDNGDGTRSMMTATEAARRMYVNPQIESFVSNPNNNIGEAGKAALRRGFTNGGDVASYLGEAVAYYNAGREGADINEVSHSSDSIAAPEVLQEVYNAGRADSANSNALANGGNALYNNDTEKELSESEKDAILRYKSSESYIINSKLRDGEKLSDFEQSFVDNFDKALQKLPTFEGTAYRNVSFDDFGGKEAMDAFMAEHTEGAVVGYSGYTSTSMKADGHPINGEYVVNIVIENSTTGKVLEGHGNNFEAEVLFPRRTVFKVNKILYNGKTPIIYVEEKANYERQLHETGGEYGQLHTEERGDLLQQVQTAGSVHMQEILERDTLGSTYSKDSVRGVRGKGEISENSGANSQTFGNMGNSVSGAARLYAELSGEVTNDVADRIAADGELRREFEKLTGVTLTDNVAKNRSIIRKNALLAAESYKQSNIDNVTKAVARAGYENSITAMVGEGGALLKHGREVYNSTVEGGIRDYTMRGLYNERYMHFNAEFGAYYNAGYKNSGFAYLNNSLSEADAKAAYEAGRADSAESLSAAISKNKRSGLIIDDYVSENWSPKLIERVDVLSKKLGIIVRTADSVDGGRANAEIRGNVVTLERGNKNPELALIGHEILHHLQNIGAKQYTSFVNAVRAAMGEEAFNRKVDEKLARYRKNDTEFAREKAIDEVAADYAGKLLEDGRLLDRFVKGSSKNVVQKFFEAVRTILDKIGYVLSYDARRNLKDAEAKLYELLGEGAETAKTKNAADSGEVRNSLKYDYTKSFAEQIEDYKNGIIPKYDTLLVGSTPKILQEIGFNALPVTINQRHIDYALNGTKNAEHFLGDELLKQLPEALKEPIAIISSKTKNNTSLVAMLELKHSGEQIIVPVVIDGLGHQNGIIIDSNALTSVYGRNNSLKMLANAINDEANGNLFSVYYLNKNKATALLQGSRVTMPKMPTIRNDGFVHSITETNSPVKPKFENVTLTRQFKRWFGDWEKSPSKASKVVNEDGTPKIVYHGTDAKFSVFDMTKGRANMDIQGAFFSPYEIDASGYGTKVGAYYLNLRNPADERTAYKALNLFKGQNNAGVKAKEYLIKQGYDGVYNGYDEYIAFYPEQIKSATDNIGTFDGNNPDVRYSLKTDTIEESKLQGGELQYAIKGLSDKYIYENLIKKPDMEIVDLSKTVDGMTRKEAVEAAIKNAVEVGRKNAGGGALVYVKDIDKEISIGPAAIRHGFDRRFNDNGNVALKIGEVLKNTIRINNLIPRNQDIGETYVLIGIARQKSSNGTSNLYIVNFLVNESRNAVEDVVVLYSMNAKKEKGVTGFNTPEVADESAPLTTPTISISDLLDYVNKFYPDILPESVLKHYGYKQRPEGKLGKSALYSFKTDTIEESELQDREADTEADIPTFNEISIAPVSSAVKMLECGIGFQKVVRDTGVSLREISLLMETQGADGSRIRELTGMYRDANGGWQIDEKWIEQQQERAELTRAELQDITKSMFSLSAAGISEGELDSVRAALDKAASVTNRVIKPRASEYKASRGKKAARLAVEQVMKNNTPSARCRRSYQFLILEN